MTLPNSILILFILIESSSYAAPPVSLFDDYYVPNIQGHIQNEYKNKIEEKNKKIAQFCLTAKDKTTYLSLLPRELVQALVPFVIPE